MESIQHQLAALDLPQVKLLHRTATDFEGIDIASFDVVILNSIVQYFPSADYLIQVLKGALQRVTSGGVLFVGDVRNLPLLKAFHAWMKLSQAEDGMERSQLQQQVERSHFEEPELVIDPALFYTLPEQFPQIRRVQVRLSRGRSQNEMTQFRYNVLLYVEELISPTSTPFTEKHDWRLDPIPVEEIQKYLMESEPEIFLITNVTNSRIHLAIKTVSWLQNQTLPRTVGRMREELQDSAERAIAPQDWWDLETVLPYRVEVTWSTQTSTGSYDVLLIRRGVDAAVPTFDSPGHSWNHYTNDPLQSSFARQLVPELRQFLGKTLPDYMVPSVFVPLAALPLTASGKGDRRALPPINDDSTHSLSITNISSTPIEFTLIEIWKELLQLKQVSVHDNFFELGGHSLLATQMTSRVRDAFGLELPLKNVFEAPTIAQLALILEARDTPSTAYAPPLVRLDRSAYRRRSPSLSAPPLPELQLPNCHSQTPQDLPKGSASVHARSITSSRSPLVPLTLGHGEQPFFCVHPMFGVVFPYLELAHYLENMANQFPDWGHRSFYGLQPLGLDGKSAPLNRIEAIATCYIQAIRELQPQGPYFLGGWSFGGLVAFEMAQQLTQAGQEIGLLAILDTPAPANQLSLGQSLKFLLGTALWSTLPFLLDYGALVTNRLQSWHPWFARWQGATSSSAFRAIARLLPEESRLQLLNESAIQLLLPVVYANSQAAYRYVPQPYPHRITLFKAAEQPEAMRHEPFLGWNTLTHNIQLHQVSGNHLSLLRQPHVQTLAEQLGKCLSCAAQFSGESEQR
ncbi:MAG: hypothetical protein HC899_32665 [Leptolyngbyaceae cyanobacterium SM1_4_3]|nr:hypothetical protein [Leptolyngbyaceae cyanobacterium SM1_4_3]